MALFRSEGRSDNRAVASVLVSSFLLVLGTSFAAPLVPGLAETYAISTVQASLLLSAIGLGRIAFDLGGGILVDRLGLKRVALTGCAVTAVGAFGAGASTSFVGLLAAQIVQGVGSALYTTAAMSFVIHRAAGARLGRSVSSFMGVMVLAFSVGPVISGLAAARYGLRGPFYGYAGAAITAFALTTFLPSDPRRGSRGPTGISPAGTDVDHLDWRASLPVIRVLLTSRPYLLALLAATGMYWMRAGVRNTLLPVFAAHEVGFDERSIAFLLGLTALGGLLVLPIAGRVLDRAGRRPVLLVSVFGTGLAMYSLAAVTGPSWLYALAFVLGVVAGYGNPAPAVILSDVVPQASRGTAVGLLRMGMDLGIIIGPVTLGALVDWVDPPGAFVASGTVFVALGCALLAIPETVPGRTVSS